MPTASRYSGIQPEHAAHPERPHAALALQRGRHDVAADDEEDEDAVVARVEIVIDDRPNVLERVVAEVVEDHRERRQAAEHVEPAQSRSRPGRIRRGTLRGLGRFGHGCRLYNVTAGHDSVTRIYPAMPASLYIFLRGQSALGSSHIVVATPRRARTCLYHSYHRPFGILLCSIFSSERPRSFSPFSLLGHWRGRHGPAAATRDPARDWPCPTDCCYDHSVLNAPLAQLAEQRTLNPRVRGSSPWRRTRSDLGLRSLQVFLFGPFHAHGSSTFARQSGPKPDTMKATEPLAQARAAVALLSKALDHDDPATLNRAVELLRSALAGTGGQPVPPGWLSNLGVALRIRYVRLGVPGDLDEAIELGRRAVRGDHSQRPWHLANLAAALRLRALRPAASSSRPG